MARSVQPSAALLRRFALNASYPYVERKQTRSRYTSAFVTTPPPSTNLPCSTNPQRAREPIRHLRHILVDEVHGEAPRDDRGFVGHRSLRGFGSGMAAEQCERPRTSRTRSERSGPA